MIDVLIVEDDSFVAELYEKQLGFDGFTTAISKDGEEAIKFLGKEIPKAVLLDIMLPKVSGIEVLRFMKNDPKLKKIPVVILSNLGQDEIVNEAIGLGANSYLVKANFVPEQVVKEIKNLL